MRYVLLIIFFGMLVGCQNHPITSQPGDNSHQKQAKKRYSIEKDSAPPGPVPSFFKRIFPISEPLSRYGNPGSYKVDGRTYQVMTSAKGYRTRGTASWYGTKFHSQRTSSGEAYNMYALTAAHKTLPLPTYIRVKNLNNGKVAVVKVNDRGPFHSDRILDLSYGAAVKLGIFPKGTAQVEIEALSVKGSGKEHVARYYLQAGAFGSKKYAESFRMKLSKFTRLPVFIEKYQQRFIVKVGPLTNKRMTDSLRSTLAKKGITGTFSVLV